MADQRERTAPDQTSKIVVDRSNTKRGYEMLADIAKDPVAYEKRRKEVAKLQQQATDAAKKATTDNRYQTVDQTFQKGYEQAGLTQASIANKQQTPVQKVQAEYYSDQPAVQSFQQQTRTQKKKPNAAAKAFARTRVSGINMWVWGLVGSFYILQLTFALLSTAGLGMWFAIEQLTATGNITPVDGAEGSVPGSSFSIGGKVVTIAASLVGTIFTHLAAAAKYLFDIDISIFDPFNLFVAMYSVIMFFGWLQLAITAMMYYGGSC